MLRSFLTMSIRQLLVQKLYTAINVVGLTLGLACALLITLFVRHELSYDRHYALADRIVRISDDVVASDPSLHFAGTAPIVATLLPDYFSEIDRTARLSTCFAEGTNISLGGSPSFEPSFVAADSELFEIFDFKWLQGDPKTALSTPTALVLTESLARRHFGTENPMGRTVALQGFDTPFEVTGVLRDLPDNTHLQFNLLVSLQIMPPQALESWGNNCYQTYAVLRGGRAAFGAVQSGLGQFLEERFSKGSSSVRALTATPITDIHLRSTREGEMRPPGSRTVVYTFAAIAAFVSLIACINFTNLATARAMQRAKEVGVRKAVGGARRQLIAQFLAESLLVAVIASVLAMTLVALVLTPFGSFIERKIAWHDLASLEIGALVSVTTLVVGVVAGSYPAFFLSAFKPVRVLKGDVARGNTAAAVRKALVVLQFAISITLGVATMVVLEQEQFARAFELGYDMEQVVVLSGTAGRGLGPQWEAMKRQWLDLPEVRAVSASNVTPGTRSGVRTLVKAAGADGYGFVTSLMLVEQDFLETYEIDLLAGRSFAESDGAHAGAGSPVGEASTAPRKFVLNEVAVERLGWTVEDAPGRLLDVNGPGIVVGVVENVHLESVRDPLVPVAYHVPPVETAEIREASIRVTGRDLERTLADVDAIWRRLGPGTPVVRRFLDADFEALYRGERRQAQLLTAFSLLAIMIACLGLYGLASFSTMRRTKEIGIRKSLGASVPEIVRLFATEFGALVLIANVIAWPIAYFAMQRWLSGYAYRIELGPLVFVASAALALAVALLTVAAVAARVARAKPVEALRYE